MTLQRIKRNFDVNRLKVIDEGDGTFSVVEENSVFLFTVVEDGFYSEEEADKFIKQKQQKSQKK